MATTDELRCMATLCANLHDAAQQLSGHTMRSSIEQEAIELLELIPQILETDVHPGRIAALLFQVEPPPLAVACRLTHNQLALSAKLRAFALKTITQVVSVALSPDCADYLGTRIREACTELHVLPLLLSIIEKGNEGSDAEAAAELLFVLTMQLPSIRMSTIADHPGPAVLVRRLGDTDGEQMRSYVCATMRVLCQSQPGAFAEPEVGFFRTTVALLREGPSLQIGVLLLESLAEVVSHFSSVYVTELVGTTSLLDDLTDAVTAMLERGDMNDELRGALNTFLRVAIAIEGSCNNGVLAEGHGVRAAFVHITAWQRAMSTAAGTGHATFLLSLQRWLVQTAVMRQHVAALSRPFMESFPTLCVLLNPEKSARAAMTEAALIVALSTAKVLALRRDVGKMVAGYDAWAENLRGTISACLHQDETPTYLRSMPDEMPESVTDIVKGLFIVDEHQCLLNDPELLARVQSLDPPAVARAIFAEQERRSTAAMRQNGPVPLARVRDDLYSPVGNSRPARAVEAAASLALATLERSVALALTPQQVREEDAALRGDATVIASNLSDLSNRPMHVGDEEVQPHEGFATPQRGGRATTPRRGRQTTPRRGNVSVSQPTPTPRTKTPQQARQERVTKALRMFSTPSKKPAFRPSSAAHQTATTPVAVAATSVAGQTRRGGFMDSLIGTAGQPLLLESLTISGRSDEYISLAIMMHLPVTYGVHYNRDAKAVVRKVASSSGVYAQPVFRNTSHSWTAADVREGDLYVLFVPFHKLNDERLESEVQTVQRYLVATKKMLVTTPQQQRSRRWLLHDLLNYVLPKTELLLRDFMSLVKQFGAENVVYQLGVIRLLDEGKRERQDVLSTALDESDAAMPAELLRLSSGRLKDILHSGNLAYAVRRLREHFFATGDDTGHAGASPIAHDDPNRSAMDAGGAPVSQLASIDRAIDRLERQAMEDRWGNEDAAEAADDVEVAYDDGVAHADMSAPSHHQPLAAASRLLDPHRYAGGDDAGQATEETAPPLDASPAPAAPPHAPSPAGHGRRDRNVPPSEPVDSAGELSALPQHLRAAFDRGEGAATETSSFYRGANGSLNATSGLAATERPPKSGDGQAPTMTDFDAMYAAVERSYRDE